MTFTEKVKFFFTKIGSSLLPFVKIFVSSAGQILGSIALDVVKQIAADPSMIKAGGLAKRQAAFDLIVKDLKGKGLELGVQVSTSMINAAIEAAVQKAKEGE